MAKHIPHIFLSPEETESRQLSEESYHHLIRVIRLKENYSFFVLDNLGNRFDCKVQSINKHSASFEIISQESFSRPKTKLTLMLSLLKTDKFEEILDKSTQLGVDEIIPFVSEYSSVSRDFYEKKYNRFNTIIKTAAEQAQRVFLPVLNEIREFSEILNEENIIVAYEKSDKPLKEILRNFSDTEINILFGPEGGLSEEEVSILAERNFSLVSLGKNILRAETAVITALGIIKYELGI